MSNTTPIQASVGVTPTAKQLPDNVHFTFYAFEQDDETGMQVGRLFEVQTFEIHRIVDVSSPCFIDADADHAPFPGLHVSQYSDQIIKQVGWPDATPPAGATEKDKEIVATALQRQKNVTELGSDMGLNVISGASNGGYPEVAADCNDTTKIPPPTCVDKASNDRRLAMCKTAWSHDPEYFEGTDRVLTVPLNGKTHGMVDGMNPVNLAPVGGAQFYVDENLIDFQGYAVYWQYDDANHDGKPDYPPGTPATGMHPLGTQLLYGRPTAPTRGVQHVHMTSLSNPSVTAEVAIFDDLDQDDTHF